LNCPRALNGALGFHEINIHHTFINAVINTVTNTSINIVINTIVNAITVYTFTNTLIKTHSSTQLSTVINTIINSHNKQYRGRNTVTITVTEHSHQHILQQSSKTSIGFIHNRLFVEFVAVQMIREK
jgi:hypothetical protein